MLQINENWRLVSDDMCVTLQKRSIVKVKENGEETGEEKEIWTNNSYHRDFKQALKWMVRNEIQTCNEFKNIVDKVDYLESLIDSLRGKIHE